ncbi:hypothetical protein ACFWUW_18015 [Streptomyces sp. NPDC058655]|uniref:hypothetical protein n=1 Tax=Streptomyces sp. NPDC058655 TaxID=3346577 RepID=UPI003661A778
MACGTRPLAVVACLFTAVQFALVVPGSGIGWDEAVYVSQVSPYVPAAFFSAPRARGITFLAAPAAALSQDPTALRIWFALLSGAALFGSFRLWLAILRPAVVVSAAGLFASLWITLLYGSQAMPNLWVAYGALAAVACLLLPASRGTHAGLAAAMALVALMRPSDALWLALPLAAAALASRAPGRLVALTGGVALGALPWVVEAHLRYGGLTARLHRAGEIQGGFGGQFAFGAQLRALSGRTLCRPCSDVPLNHPELALWWLGLPVAVAAGIAVARGRRRPLVLATAAAASVSVPYLFLIGYAAPRFLLPAYALLALPAAQALVHAARTWRRPALAALAFALAGHLAVQYAVLDRAADRYRLTRTAYARTAQELHGHGVRPPCTVSGHEAVRVAYALGCSSRQVGGHDGSIGAGTLQAMACLRPVVLLTSDGAPPPAYARTWRPHGLSPLPGLRSLHAYLPPGCADRAATPRAASTG